MFYINADPHGDYNKIDNWVNDEKLEGVKNEIINAHMLRAM